MTSNSPLRWIPEAIDEKKLIKSVERSLEKKARDSQVLTNINAEDAQGGADEQIIVELVSADDVMRKLCGYAHWGPRL